MLRKVTKVVPISPKILCTLSSGEIVEYDLSLDLQGNGPMIQPLRDPNTFAMVFLESGIPTWPNGMCVCPDEIFLNGIRKDKAS